MLVANEMIDLKGYQEHLERNLRGTSDWPSVIACAYKREVDTCKVLDVFKLAYIEDT